MSNRDRRVWYTCVNCGALAVETHRDMVRYGWPKVCRDKPCKTTVKPVEPLRIDGPEFRFEDTP